MAWLSSRTAQSQAPAGTPGPDPLQLLASDVDQLKAHSLQLKADLEILNQGIAAREDRLRKWLLALLVWNVILTIGLVLAILVVRH
jgi:hypothetical protein